ncbi:MAG TPA: nitroreductase/quinone reductase family protein [Candidatus Dormibacteraeota bacterium]|nr:nitroreductase/quinone reductase family protein [Candidatus Dormibacteraeota bacterium]
MSPLAYVDPYARHGPLYLAICRLSVSRPGMWLARHVAWKLDPLLLRLSRGRVASTGPIASALLETRGARTGRPRRTATLYFNDGDRVILVASKQGAPESPAWYHNLRKDPDVLFGGVQFQAAVIEDEAEQQRLWQLADRVFPQFATYRAWAARDGRTIPIIALQPR